MISIDRACSELDEGQLVARSIAGDIEAFREIGVRYYPLVRTLAYAATASLNQSDNLARDTLVAAWRQLGDMHEPARLRSLLCGIACDLINHSLRHATAAGARTDVIGSRAR